MARIVGVDLPSNKRGEIALTYIYGIGRSLSLIHIFKIIIKQMKYVPNLKTKYNEEIVPTLMKEFGYKSVMQAPRLEKIVINQGVGSAIQDKKILEFSLNEITAITGQKAVVGRCV